MALVDVHRELVAATGATPDPESPGRSLRAPVAASIELPRPSGLAWVVAVVAWLSGAGFVAWRHGRDLRRWPWWIALAWLGSLAVAGSLTLSNPAVYPKLPVRLWLGGSAGAIWGAYALRRADGNGDGNGSTLATVGDLVVPWGAGALGIVALAAMPAGYDTAIVLPPLVPTWTALSSAWLAWGALAFAAAGLSLAYAAWRVREPEPR